MQYTEVTLATPANMRRIETETVMGVRAVAYSPNTGEEYSATPGDYWHMRDDEPLRDREGEPMILARAVLTMVDAVTGTTL